MLYDGSYIVYAANTFLQRNNDTESSVKLHHVVVIFQYHWNLQNNPFCKILIFSRQHGGELSLNIPIPFELRKIEQKKHLLTIKCVLQTNFFNNVYIFYKMFIMKF